VRFGPATKRGYKRKNFEDVWQRYLPAPKTPISTDTTTQASHSAGFSPISKRHNNEVCHSEKPLKASDSKGCVDVSLKKGDSGRMDAMDAKIHTQSAKCARCDGEGCSYCKSKFTQKSAKFVKLLTVAGTTVGLSS